MERTSGVVEGFADKVIEGVRRARSAEAAAAVASVVKREWPERASAQEEAALYFALCERAWLHWSRLALDFITIRGLHRASLGIFNPARIRSADEAAAAESMCGYHRRLLDEVPDDVNYPEWQRHLEQARHVLLATQKALKIGADLDTLDGTDLRQLNPGITWAADALATAFAAGFVANVPTETRETIEAMLRHD
jgi:hypothetical protein